MVDFDTRTAQLDDLLGVGRNFDMVGRDLRVGGRNARLWVVNGYAEDMLIERMIGRLMAIGDLKKIPDLEAFLTAYVTVPDAAAETVCGAPLLLLEANHDVEMLRGGPYPYYLKRRILSDQGHLSNEAAARFAAESCRAGTAEIVLVHLSKENNTPAAALAAVSAALEQEGLSPALSVAPREGVSVRYETAEVVCRR